MNLDDLSLLKTPTLVHEGKKASFEAVTGPHFNKELS